jgi:MFS family permease
MTYGAVVSFLALYAQTMNVTNVGPFFTMYAITLMITRPLFGRIADKKGFDNCYAAGYSLCPSNNANSFCSAQPARIYVGGSCLRNWIWGCATKSSSHVRAWHPSLPAGSSQQNLLHRV